MRKRRIYICFACALPVMLGLVMLTVLLRIAVRSIAVESFGVQSTFVDAVMFDCPALAALPNEEVNSEKESRAPTEPVRDRDGIIWSTKVDWSTLYPPYETEKKRAETGAFWVFAHALANAKAHIAPLETAVTAFEDGLNVYTSDYVVFYSKMVETANAYDKLLGWEIAGVSSYNPVIEAGDNYFLTCVGRKDETPRAEESIALKSYLDTLGMAHLFVETPNKTCREDPQSGVADFYNQNADRLLGAMERGGVSALDLRESLHEAGMNHHDSFYQTDHHWKAETGLWAAGVLAQRLNADYGFSIDISLFEPTHFDYEVYEDWFLGSQGKKVTLSRAKPENISLIYPKCAADLSIEIPSLSVSKRGDFSVLYRYAPVAVCDYYEQNPYAAYLYGDNALTRITNHNISDGGSILMLGHSFDNSVIPFLALGVSRIDSIDLREFSGDLKTFLAENHYDIVVELYTA